MGRSGGWRVLGLALATLASGLAIGKSPDGIGEIRVDWYSINAGAGNGSSGGEYQLRGSIGQAVVGGSWGGDYALNAGFWQARGRSCASASDSIFCSGFEE